MGERHFKGIIDKEDLIKFNDKVALLVENGKIWKGNHPEMRSWILGLDRIPAVQDASDSNSGVPSPWVTGCCWSVGRTGGGLHWADQQSLICTYSCSSSRALPPVGTGAALDSHRSRNPLGTAHYDELYNYVIIYHHEIIIKCTIKVTCLNHPETIPLPKSAENFSSRKLIHGA